ncbi:MAG: hypothetical protein ABMA15_01115 [Vicinamibacterales bacterium]
MLNKTVTLGNELVENAKTAAQDLTERVRNSASEAAAAIGESRSTAADGLDTAASALHGRADDLPGGDTVRNFARSTADRLSTSAKYMRSHDAKRMASDAETFVKSNPGPALVVAAAFGFLLGRAFSRD